MSKVWDAMKDFLIFGLYFTAWSAIAAGLGSIFLKVTGLGSTVRGWISKE